MLAFGYIKISFKPITSKTETCGQFLQHYGLKKKNKKPPIYPKEGGKNPKTLSFDFWITTFSSIRTKGHTLESKSKVQIFYVIMFKIQWSKVSEMPDTQLKRSVEFKKDKVKQQAIPFNSKWRFQTSWIVYKSSLSNV